MSHLVRGVPSQPMFPKLDFGLTGPETTVSLPPIPTRHFCLQGLAVETVGFEALCHSTGKVLCANNFEPCGKPPEELQELSWQQVSSIQEQWYVNIRSMPTLLYTDFQNRKSKVDLWINWHKTAWVDSQLAPWDTAAPESTFPDVPCQGASGRDTVLQDHLKGGMSRRICEYGRTTDAVEALNLLVRQGGPVHGKLLYRALKNCIAHKDLVLGRHIHALTIQFGYEGDTFLATHLIGMYAAHGRLEDAMRVFTKVSMPDSYNWATIIFTCARHGEAAQAIWLYEQMRQSTVEPTDYIFVAALKACAAAKDIVAGKEVHVHILASPWKSNIFVQTGLVDMYAKCGSLEDARRVFDSLPERNVVTWNALFGGYARQGMVQEALGLYSRMLQEGITSPDSFTFACLLQACARVGATSLDQGQQLYAQIQERGLQDDLVLGGSLVNMYAKCGSLEDARSMFNRLSKRNLVTWNAMLAGYAQQRMGGEALSLYKSMQEEGLTTPDLVTFVCLLQACAGVGVAALDQGKQIHEQIKQQGLQGDVVLGGSLVSMYVKCGSLQDARSLFNRLPNRNVVTWNAIIGGYAQQGMVQEALCLYSSMQQEGLTPPDTVTFVCLLQACANIGVAALSLGKQLHAQIEERDLQVGAVLGGSLVNMYAKCSCLEDARCMFDRLADIDVVTWTAMIGGYVQQGTRQEALTLYKRMQKEGLAVPDCYTFTCLLQICASVGIGSLDQGKKIHAQIEEQGLEGDVVLGGTLVAMYAKCGSLEDARSVFDYLPDRNVATWNAMLAGYAEGGMGQKALSLYISMQKEGITCPDSCTFACLLQACAIVGVGALDQGKLFHAQIEERGLQIGVVLGGSLVNMYAKCGSLKDAHNVFDSLPDRNVVMWTVMIAGYAQQAMVQEAQSLYKSMQQEGVSPDSVTFVCLLQACATVAALSLGKQLHAEIEDQGLQADPVVGAALINMYSKCGNMFDAQRVFDSLPEKTIEVWGALTGGYTRQGDSEVVFNLLDRMRLEGVQPNGVVFLSVLTVCSHLGLEDEGRRYFKAMKTDYGISPTVHHYTCMMDLLGRAGHLDQALQMAKTMPFPPDGAVWLTLLSACRKWRNEKIGKLAFEQAVSVDETDTSSYMLMSNIYASAQMCE